MLAKLHTAELLAMGETEGATPVCVLTWGKDAAVYTETKPLSSKKEKLVNKELFLCVPHM